jgi:hypothetical protein
MSASVGARLRYRFDNALARGPFVVISYLALLTLVVIFVAAVVSVLFGMTFGGGVDDTFPEAIWQAMLRMVDAGTFAGDTAWPTRILAIVVTLIGIFLAGSLIGLIANAVDQQVESLNRGRGAVIESGHTLILGWSSQVPQIISELVIANESEKDASVVVLSRTEKTEMEETIREAVGDTKTTRVVCRNGDPSMPADLERACVATAKSIIAVRDEDGDAAVVKALLAIRSLDRDFARCHVVAEIAADDNAQTIRTVTNGRVLTVSSDRIVAEVTAQACLQTGIAAVWADLLDFDGDEIYFAPPTGLVGRSYAEAQLGFESSSVIGRLSADGVVHLNPPANIVIGETDQLVLVASDDSAIAFSGIRTVDVPEPADPLGRGEPPVRALVIGWSSFGRLVLEQLDEFLVPGSSLHILVDQDLVDPSELAKLRMNNATLTVGAGRGGPEDIFTLAASDTFDQVIVLGYRDVMSASDADARTLLSLLTLRMVWPQERGTEDYVRIVAELVDQRNLAIATPVGIDDLIVSDALASLTMAQLAEHAELLEVFEDLFDPKGPVISLVPAESLVPTEPLEYAVVVAAASAKGVSAFGVRRVDGSVQMNPSKSTPMTLGRGDHVIAIEHRTKPEPVAPARKRSPRSTRTQTTRKQDT